MEMSKQQYERKERHANQKATTCSMVSSSISDSIKALVRKEREGGMKTGSLRRRSRSLIGFGQGVVGRGGGDGGGLRDGKRSRTVGRGGVGAWTVMEGRRRLGT
jgi:hypothetical protein